MMIEKMTTTMQEALGQAQQIAITRQHQEIDIPHLWHVLIQPNEFAARLYEEIGVPMEEFRHLVNKEIDALSVVSGSNVQYGQAISQRLNQLFVAANQIAKDNQDEFLSTEVVLLALYKQKGNPLTQFLNQHDISESKLKERIDQLRGGSRVTSQNQEETYEA